MADYFLSLNVASSKQLVDKARGVFHRWDWSLMNQRTTSRHSKHCFPLFFYYWSHCLYVLLEPICRFAILIVKGDHGCTIHTYDVSMKARPKGHIAIKLYEAVVKRPLQLQQKIVLTNAALLRFVIIVPIIRETHVFPKDPCRRLVSPLSTFQRMFIYYDSRNILWG